ncbi:carboxylesterase/lipase family protein [Yinghuangia seranimata]|uniref:carboxylesterase/lipase family protein n=1 Tax=Yinghuangia seranimata TaxID=408067 RepID=UPI00248C1D8A|nr:carboxylesterase family protein [Yinghuangia seranimata]MDI2126529.1 carboxylesterase family protein [Yinghuangia seranimata]
MPARSPRLARLTTTLAVLAASVLALTATPARADGSGPVVPTRSGVLRGQVHDNAEEFLGVPYAAPPVGALRFRAPQPAAPWRGVRDATRQGPACVQFVDIGIDPAQPRSEDCLSLDLYRPRWAHPGTRLPVIVWIHGGAWVQGTGTQFGGRTTADLTGAIVVSINYRLGALGYLALPGLDAESREGSGNWGTLDQAAALRWVHDNAAAFGGDPGNVTVTGQSAGSGSVCALLASPAATGLFSHAVMQSGPCGLLAARPLAGAQAQGQAYAQRAGCPDPAAAVSCLRGASTAALVSASDPSEPVGPVSGTPTLPVQPRDAIASGRWNKVPVVIGGTRSEGLLFALGSLGMTPDQYAAAVRTQFGPAADQVLARYPLSAYPAPFYAWAAVLTDSGWACGTAATAAAFARQVPTYQYEFDDPNSPPLLGLDIPGVNLGNAHSAELAYLFDFTMQGRAFTPEQQALATRMKRTWAAFAWTGSPNGPGLAAWPRVAADGTAVLKFQPGGDTVFAGFADEHQCGFWQSFGA